MGTGAPEHQPARRRVEDPRQHLLRLAAGDRENLLRGIGSLRQAGDRFLAGVLHRSRGLALAGRSTGCGACHVHRPPQRPRPPRPPGGQRRDRAAAAREARPAPQGRPLAVRLATLLTVLLALPVTVAADEAPKKPNVVERTADKTAKGVERTVTRTGKWAGRTADRAGKAVDRTAKRTEDWVRRKTE